MDKTSNRLKRCAGRYRLGKGEDGIRHIETRFKSRDGMDYNVYDYSDTYLAACLPPGAGSSLMKRYPRKFALHQDAYDAKVLLFLEEDLDELAGVLKLRCRKRLSEENRRMQIERLQQFQFEPASKREKAA